MKAMVVICIALCACTPRSLREAQEVVAQADSLWHEGQIYGVDGGDSATLAQAYERLKELSAVSRQLSDVSYQLSEVCPFVHHTSLLSTYAHACYHYGKLLRAKDNPVEAMRVFIDATHSGTKDYHILGRVYSNMGDICHLAGEFQLSYDMFERSAEMFLRNGDTLLYYYLLNDMAFELAEQGKKEETFILLDSIAHNCNDRNVKIKTLETKTKLYFQIQLYDSVIYTTNILQLLRYSVPTCYELKARAFWHMGQVDFALYYANQVLNMPTASEQNKYNMLYIIANADSTLSNEDVLALSAQRSDIETDILIPLHSKWGLAVQLLQQDLNRKPDWRWFWGVVATLLVVGLCLWLYIFRKHKQRALLSQQVEDLTIQNEEAKDQQIKRYNDRLLRIQENCDILANSDSIMDSLQWKNYDKFCECINIHFFLLADKLKATGRLNEKEIRLCVLVLIGSFTDKQMANILYYSYNSIRSTKRTLANKLGTTSANLRSFLIEKAAK
ncbi:MAG: hypothetical protein IJ548_02230 [Paludibacteraceae bacterium]|nr:hypothetical protein [Paludibacteraceae bacterium]MBQ8705104.1 hypothetical protein [Paludibacteraceae bacterium]